MAYTFKGIISNDLRPERGINFAITGFGDKVIIQPTKSYEIETSQDKNPLKFKVALSSETTEPPKAIKVEVKNGTEKTTTNSDSWEFEITAKSDKNPAEVNISIYKEYPKQTEF